MTTISDERLAEIVGAGVPCVPIEPWEVAHVVQELRSLRAYRTAANPLQSVLDKFPGAKVKPLEWSYGTLGRHEATTPFGTETVHEVCFDGKGGKVACAIWGEVIYQSVYEAKSAAQADYERRILSALESTG